MSSIEFPTEQYVIWENQAKEGGRAKDFKASPYWPWFQDRVIKTLETRAVNTLKNAKSDADRLMAQQMFLAASAPEQLLEFLITQGDGAKANLIEVSTLKEGDNDGMA